MKSQLIFGYFLIILLACKHKDSNITQAKQTARTKLPVPSLSVDTSTVYETIQAIEQNRGCAEGITTTDIVAQKEKALSFIKRVLASKQLAGGKDVFDIGMSEDSSFYQVDYYPYSMNNHARPQTMHLFFFPRTKKIFFFHYGDTLVTSECTYDTVIFKYRPPLKK